MSSSLWLRVLALLVFSGLACGKVELDGVPEVGEEAPESQPIDAFIDVAEVSGLDFRHVNGMRGELFYSEIMGSGAALFDYDNDGDLDLYLVQGGAHRTAGEIRADEGLPSDRLYRNELTTSGTLRFTDVTVAAGISATGYGMGVVAADYDNDGYVDLYVTNLGPNELWRNQGDGTFVEVAAWAGTNSDRWSSSATFADIDHDGWLDLYVANYLDFTLEKHKPCYSPLGARDYCSPSSYEPQPDQLYSNRRDGTFAEISTSSGIGGVRFGGLGVVASDLNRDGWTDFYVANDQSENQLWINQTDGRFQDTALLAGCALNAEGSAEASMGVDAGDFDNDGDLDLFLSHLDGESNTLYLNEDNGYFVDATSRYGLLQPSRRSTGFGTAWLDYDMDSWLDLLVVNGAVITLQELARTGDPFPLHQPNQLFRNMQGKEFRETSEWAGAALRRSEVSRGAAFGDVDNDGDTDLVIVNNNGPVRLLSNETPRDESHWIGLQLTRGEERDSILGAMVEVVIEGGVRLLRRQHVDGSYLSSNDPRVLIGIGKAKAVESLTVRWPDGSWETFVPPSVDGYHEVARGSGERVDQQPGTTSQARP